MDLVLQSGFNSVRLQSRPNNLDLTLRTTPSNLNLQSVAPNMILRASGSLVTIDANGGTYLATYNDVFPVTFMSLLAVQTIDKISISIIEEFDGTGASLKLGSTTDDDEFFETTEVELTTKDLVFEKDFSVDGPKNLKLTIVPGTAASKGIVKIQISTTKKGI